MKPGDLLKSRRPNLPGFSYLNVWSSPESNYTWVGHWLPDQVGILLTGRQQASDAKGRITPDSPYCVEVLLGGRAVWVEEEEVEVIVNEPVAG
jgi:hypothetical protein